MFYGNFGISLIIGIVSAKQKDLPFLLGPPERGFPNPVNHIYEAFFHLYRNFKEAIFINNCLIFSLSSRRLEVIARKSGARERDSQGKRDLLLQYVSLARSVLSCAHHFHAT